MCEVIVFLPQITAEEVLQRVMDNESELHGGFCSEKTKLHCEQHSFCSATDANSYEERKTLFKQGVCKKFRISVTELPVV